MISRVKKTLAEYPFQFWVLFCGRFIGSAGGSLVWPFMTIYLRQRLNISLTTVGLLFAVSSGVGLVSQFIWGPVIDRFGRKTALLVGLANEVVVMVAFGLLGSLEAFAILIALSGLIEPSSRIATSTIVADIIEPERRPSAYALLRMIANLGVAIGPAVGGFLATRSYFLSFMAAAASAAIFLLLSILFIKETKPEVGAERGEGIGGYGRIVRDYHFLAFCGAYTLLGMAYAQMMTLLPVYIKEGYGILESGYGFIMATNAAMVVLFQYSITRVTERYRAAPILAAGALFTALGVGSVALGGSFPLFWMSMVILTIGEMLVIPTSVSFVADTAPVTMRGRYMGVFGLTWGIAFGVGPILGGYLNDKIAPVYIWYEAFILGLLSTLAFQFIGMVITQKPAVPSVADGEGLE
ncbi:MAG: MDR family MFS transporter [Anaerolineae bacterium]